MKRTYLQISGYGGIDWNDIHTAEKQVYENESPVITDVRKAILDDIYDSYPDLDRVKLEEVYDNPLTVDEYVVPIPDEAGSITAKYNADGDFCVTLESQFSWEDIYKVEEIDDKNVIYLVVEEYQRAIRCKDTVERFYHEPFVNYASALEHMKTTGRPDDGTVPLPGDELLGYPPEDRYDKRQIFVFDKEKIKENNWFKLNMKAIALMKEVGDYCFRVSVVEHIEALEKAKEEQEREERD